MSRGKQKSLTKRYSLKATLIGVAFVTSACGEIATLPVAAGTGPNPTLPPPQHALIPTVNIAPAIGWPAGAIPHAAQGTRVNAFASDLDHPRWRWSCPTATCW